MSQLLPSSHHLVKSLLVERYKGVRGVGEDGSGGLFRELVPNLVVVHPLSICRDTLGFGVGDLEAKEGSSSSPFLHSHGLGGA